MSQSATGADTTWVYRWEDNFAGGNPTDDTWKTFGRDVTVGTLEGSNNAVRMFDPGSREAKEIIETNFDGSFSVNFTLSNPWWIRAVISSATTSGSSAPYTHTFSGEMPSSMELMQGLKTRDQERLLLGCIVTSCTIDATVPDEVTISLDGAYATEDPSVDVTSLTSQVASEVRPYTYAETQLHLAGSPLRKIQDASLTIENNTDIIEELGNRFGVDYSPKERNPSINYTSIVGEQNEDKLARMYGGSAADGPADRVTNKEEIRMIFDNGQSGSATQSIEFVLTGSFPDSHSRSGIGDPTAGLEDELDEMSLSVEAIAENNRDTPL
ncbi:phage tail tube protein [Natrinema thermotolerans]|uniref:phage tail tube protein n=1 Tax=Natrinema thermotolerans TaxID=121872 RepID=UPI0006788FDE|nr:phage tail tube protein [Natrinema thermotolerans]QCC57365.1 hypothetical protein DVR14_01400 [Natrinema thermotolerans]